MPRLPRWVLASSQLRHRRRRSCRLFVVHSLIQAPVALKTRFKRCPHCHPSTHERHVYRTPVGTATLHIHDSHMSHGILHSRAACSGDSSFRDVRGVPLCAHAPHSDTFTCWVRVYGFVNTNKYNLTALLGRNRTRALCGMCCSSVVWHKRRKQCSFCLNALA